VLGQTTEWLGWMPSSSCWCGHASHRPRPRNASGLRTRRTERHRSRIAPAPRVREDGSTASGARTAIAAGGCSAPVRFSLRDLERPVPASGRIMAGPSHSSLPGRVGSHSRGRRWFCRTASSAESEHGSRTSMVVTSRAGAGLPPRPARLNFGVGAHPARWPGTSVQFGEVVQPELLGPAPAGRIVEASEGILVPFGMARATLIDPLPTGAQRCRQDSCSCY
jgi:hypothetical protein